MTTTGISRPDGATRVLTESTIISYLGLPAFTEVDGNFHTADPPEHTRLRKLVSRAFTFIAALAQNSRVRNSISPSPGSSAPCRACTRRRSRCGTGTTAGPAWRAGRGLVVPRGV